MSKKWFKKQNYKNKIFTKFSKLSDEFLFNNQLRKTFSLTSKVLKLHSKCLSISSECLWWRFFFHGSLGTFAKCKVCVRRAQWYRGDWNAWPSAVAVEACEAFLRRQYHACANTLLPLKLFLGKCSKSAFLFQLFFF